MSDGPVPGRPLVLQVMAAGQPAGGPLSRLLGPEWLWRLMGGSKGLV